MKTLVLLPFYLFCSFTVQAQDTAWVSKSFDSVVTLHLPINAVHTKQKFVNIYTGAVNGNEFTFQYYDTAMGLKDEESFKISLNGFVKGALGSVSDSLFTIRASDARIGGMPGLLFRLTAKYPTLPMKEYFYFATMANDHFYSFTTATTTIDDLRVVAERFFSSIRFNISRIKESKYDTKGLLLK